MTLGDLLKSRRQQTGLSQTDIARQVPGLTRGALNNIENGVTKSVSPDIANGLVKVLPLTMGEILRASGYDLPAVSLSIPEDIAEGLEGAPEPVLAAVRLMLDGLRARQVPSKE